jgi:hypothetical protein
MVSVAVNENNMSCGLLRQKLLNISQGDNGRVGFFQSRSVVSASSEESGASSSLGFDPDIAI